MKTQLYILAKPTTLGGLFCACVLAAWTGCQREEIKVYSVPKQAGTKPMMAAINAATPDVPVSSAPVSWTTPATWKELAPTSIRIGNFQITGKNGKQADVAITRFPGNVGTELDNWNRWRGELGLGPTDEKEITSQPVVVGAGPAKLYDMTGETARTVVASLSRREVSWFFKLRGDKDVVAEAKPTLIQFLETIRFDAPKSGGPAAPAGNPAVDPHVGLNLKAPTPHANQAQAETTEGNASEPQWDVPQNWHEKPATTMVLKNFSVQGDQGGKAVIAISSFPGDVGGTFANVNRWRGQLGLPPVKENELAKIITTLEAGGSKATLVDFTGTDSKTKQPARLVAISVPQGGQTWFYKLTGDDSAVAQEKAAFIKFVQTARYP